MITETGQLLMDFWNSLGGMTTYKELEAQRNTSAIISVATMESMSHLFLLAVSIYLFQKRPTLRGFCVAMGIYAVLGLGGMMSAIFDQELSAKIMNMARYLMIPYFVIYLFRTFFGKGKTGKAT